MPHTDLAHACPRDANQSKAFRAERGRRTRSCNATYRPRACGSPGEQAKRLKSVPCFPLRGRARPSLLARSRREGRRRTPLRFARYFAQPRRLLRFSEQRALRNSTCALRATGFEQCSLVSLSRAGSYGARLRRKGSCKGKTRKATSTRQEYARTKKSDSFKQADRRLIE
jgi:hypothetical protein